MHLQEADIKRTRDIIWEFYAANSRSFAWRQTENPYHIFVSEVMLQQTQTAIVEKKYGPFIAAFPDFASLAQAPFADVLPLWRGLGYNRRALALHKSAQIIVECYGGVLPNEPTLLDELPGIGSATAASICAFAFNRPVVFIETNIRTVFITLFGGLRTDITDKELLPLIQATLDHEQPRHWYYALMDYGVMLKKTLPNPSRRSKHYIQQSQFEGSERQIRGMILKAATTKKVFSFEDLCSCIDREPERIRRNLEELCVEGFLHREGDCFRL